MSFVARIERPLRSQKSRPGPECHRVRSLNSDGVDAQAVVQVFDLKKFRPRGTVIYGLHKGDDAEWRIKEMRTEVDDAEATGAQLEAPDAGPSAADTSLEEGDAAVADPKN